MTKREKIAVSLLRPLNPSMIIVLGVYTLVWGLWIVNPFWTVFTQAGLYSQMNAIAGEWFWGGVAVSAGVVIIRGVAKPSYKNLMMGAFVAAMHWFIISIMYFIGDVLNTGGITALAFAVYAAIVYVNFKVNKKLYDKETF